MAVKGASDLKVGVMIPSQELPSDPVALRDFAQAAEQLGYEWLLLVDHVLGVEHARREPAFAAGFYDETHCFHEPFVTFAYLAGLTQTIEFRTGIMVLPQRQTALVAKQAAELALLSNSRLTLGFGLGWNWVEYDCLGIPWAERGRRMEEQIALLRRLWREPVVDFTGEFHRIERAGINPQPPAEIPIWVGGFARVAMERAVRLADGFVFSSCDEQAFGEAEQLRDVMESAGRSADSFPWEAMIEFSPGPDVWERDVARWKGVGGTHLTLRFGDATAAYYGIPENGFSTVGEYIPALEQFMVAVKASDR